jgi:tetratricopeptide (TPR) repeat protein
MDTRAEAAARHHQGVAALQRGELNAAIGHLRAAVAAEPTNPTYWVALIDALIQAGHPALADDMLQQARAAGLPLYETQMLAARISVGDEPEPQELNYIIALFNERAFAQLEPAAAVMVKRYPHCGPVWKLLGTARLMAGRAAEALPALEQAALSMPGDADVLVNLANALRAQDRLADAQVCLERALRLQPDSALLHGSLGNLYRQQQRLPEAQASYAEALRLQPGLAAARQNLGVVLAEQGELAQAEAQYRQALASQADLPDGYVNLATLLQNTGRVVEAQALLAQGLQSVSSGQWMLASLALTGCWLLRDAAGAGQLFQAYKAQAAGEQALQEDRAAHEAFWLAARLFDAMARDPRLYAAAGETQALTVLGGSHALAPAHAVFDWLGGPVRAESRRVQSLAWQHLGGRNGLRAALELQLQAAPRGAHLLLAFGALQDREQDVDVGLDWVAANAASAGFASLTVQGLLPPQHAPAATAEVNARLREECAQRGWNFLDVEAATRDAAWHIDECHLQPAFYARAVEYLVTA